MNLEYLKYDLIRNLKKERISYQKSERPRIFIYQLPIYGNIGDQAIAYSMIKFLKKNFEEYEIIENRLSYPSFSNMDNLSDRDKICLVGGGNFGDLYPYEMWYRNYIIKSHKSTEVIIFPVSIYYKKESNKKYDIKLYQHENVKVMVRENYSKDLAEEYKFHNILLVPDIVNYLSALEISKKRTNDICVLKRNDIENIHSIDSLVKHLDELGHNYKLEDNHVKHRIRTSEEMEKVVMSQLENIASYNLVITDRLHGMIMSYVTNTPAIVLSANIKIEESYNLWFKNVSNITYVKEISEIDNKLINDLINKRNQHKIFDGDIKRKMYNFINKKPNMKGTM